MKVERKFFVVEKREHEDGVEVRLHADCPGEFTELRMGFPAHEQADEFEFGKSYNVTVESSEDDPTPE